MSHLSARIVAFFSDSDTFFFHSNRPLNRKTTTFSSAEYILYLEEKKANNILQAAVTKFPYFFGVDWHGGSTTMKECRYHFTRIAWFLFLREKMWGITLHQEGGMNPFGPCWNIHRLLRFFVRYRDSIGFVASCRFRNFVLDSDTECVVRLPASFRILSWTTENRKDVMFVEPTPFLS